MSADAFAAFEEAGLDDDEAVRRTVRKEREREKRREGNRRVEVKRHEERDSLCTTYTICCRYYHMYVLEY